MKAITLFLASTATPERRGLPYLDAVLPAEDRLAATRVVRDLGALPPDAILYLLAQPLLDVASDHLMRDRDLAVRYEARFEVEDSDEWTVALAEYNREADARLEQKDSEWPLAVNVPAAASIVPVRVTAPMSVQEAVKDSAVPDCEMSARHPTVVVGPEVVWARTPHLPLRFVAPKATWAPQNRIARCTASIRTSASLLPESPAGQCVVWAPLRAGFGPSNPNLSDCPTTARMPSPPPRRRARVARIPELLGEIERLRAVDYGCGCAADGGATCPPR